MQSWHHVAILNQSVFQYTALTFHSPINCWLRQSGPTLHYFSCSFCLKICLRSCDHLLNSFHSLNSHFEWSHCIWSFLMSVLSASLSCIDGIAGASVQSEPIWRLRFKMAGEIETHQEDQDTGTKAHMSVCVCVCVYVYIYMYMYVYIYMCVCVCVCVYIYIYIYMCIYTHTHTHICVYIY